MECVETAYEIVRPPFHGVQPCFIFHSAEYMDVGSFSISLGNDVVLSYFTKNCTPAQRAVWLPKISAEGKILAVAMSEPELGSDLGSLSCRAVLFAAALLSTFVLLAPLCLRCIYRKACVSVVLRAAIAIGMCACARSRARTAHTLRSPAAKCGLAPAQCATTWSCRPSPTPKKSIGMWSARDGWYSLHWHCSSELCLCFVPAFFSRMV
jgi:hypothetical protein